MKKNSKSTIVLIILLIAVLVTVVVVNTYAKYTSKITTTSTAVAAKWSFKVNGTEIAVIGDEPTVTVNLFETIKDSDGSKTETDTSNKLAPGTSGSFDFTVQNTSEVTARYAIAFEVSNTDVPLEFKVGDGDWSDTLNIAASEDTELEAGSAVETVTISWRWAFESDDDENDTALGIAARTASTETVKVTATITATQVD